MTSEHLHKAIVVQDVQKLESILDGKSVCSLTWMKVCNTVIHVKYFSRRDQVNIDATDKYGFSPLMQAAQKGFMEWALALTKILAWEEDYRYMY